MADEEREVKKDRKYKFKFVEMFAIQEGQPVDDIDSPKYITTKNFGTRLLHQIARVVYEEFEEDTAEVEKYDESGEPVYKKVKRTVEKMGAKGGWIEKMENLSQEGDCWVEAKARVVGYASVSMDAVIGDSAEVGDSAKVTDKAEVRGEAVVGDTAYVYGEATVWGHASVSDSAKVCGRVVDSAKVYGDAFVGKDAEIAGEGKVYDRAKILSGYVRDNASVSGDAVVGAPVFSELSQERPMIRDSASVSGEALIYGGNISGKTSISDLAMVSADIKDSSISGNACMMKVGDETVIVEESTLSGNFIRSIGAGTSVKKSKIDGNVMLVQHTYGKSMNFDEASVDGNVLWASNIKESSVSGNAMSSTSYGEGALLSTLTGSEFSDCLILGRATESFVHGGVIATVFGLCRGIKMGGGVINPSAKVFDSTINSGIVIGTMSNGSISGGVVTKESYGDVSQAVFKNFPNYSGGLLVRIGQGAAGHSLVSVPKGNVEDLATQIDTEMSRIEQERSSYQKMVAAVQQTLDESSAEQMATLEKNLQDMDGKYQEKIDAAKKAMEEAIKKREEEEKKVAEAQAERDKEIKQRQERLERLAGGDFELPSGPYFTHGNGQNFQEYHSGKYGTKDKKSLRS